MKKIMLYIGLSVFIYGMMACDDDNLIPTTRPEFGYSVPQGEHEYDDRIVDWKNRCNFFYWYFYNNNKIINVTVKISNNHGMRLMIKELLMEELRGKLE